MIHRPRRLRTTTNIRHLVRETHFTKDALILPFFVEEGENIKREIPSLPGQYRYSPDRLMEGVQQALDVGITSFLLFGIPKEKTESGSPAWDPNGIVQQGIKVMKAAAPEAFVITDVCLCEYTSHGHCGVLRMGEVDNDATLPLLAQTALSHVVAGADMVAPSDMMDGRVGEIRSTLDTAGYTQIPIMSYSVKYASAFYGPFRDAAGSAPGEGDRKGYQMDFHNGKEALRELQLDEEEGADIHIVKPALSYLDIIHRVSQHTNKPVAAYNVSGEYSMIKAAAAAGMMDEYDGMCESVTSIFRAGADILITYWAIELAKAIDRGDIG